MTARQVNIAVVIDIITVLNVRNRVLENGVKVITIAQQVNYVVTGNVIQNVQFVKVTATVQPVNIAVITVD